MDIITSNSTLSVGIGRTSNGGSITAEDDLLREVRLPLADDIFLDMDIILSFVISLLAEILFESTDFVDSTWATLPLFKKVPSAIP